MSNDAGEQTKRGGRGTSPPRSGRGLATFAVLVAFAAAGLASYPYYQQITGGSQQQLTLDAARDAQARNGAELQSALRETAERFEARLQQQRAVLTERLDALEARNAVARDPAAGAESLARLNDLLRLTQAAALLQSANDRVALEHDARGGLALLIAAQELLQPIDRPDILVIRGKLTDEIKALRDAPSIDVNAIFVRLEALKTGLPDLPARTRADSAPATTPAIEPRPESMWQQMLQKFFSLFQIRRHGSDGVAPLTVDEVVYVRLNLELLLQTAQIALLRGDAAVYRQSLTTAHSWLNDYRANGSDAVSVAQAEVDQLLAQPLQVPLPDVSGALLALRGILGVPSQQPTEEAAVQVEAVAQPEAPAAPPAEASLQSDSAPAAADPDDAS
jgi:uroporphyrin-3 C-methyltransferase